MFNILAYLCSFNTQTARFLTVLNAQLINKLVDFDNGVISF